MKKVFLIIPIIILVVFCYELYMYLTQSKEIATSNAIEAFELECTKRHLSPNSFGGPTFLGEIEGVYKFKWVGQGETILVDIHFGPHYSESHYIPKHLRENSFTDTLTPPQS